jgi:thiol-disulfide isomerase/thioredoxin
MAVVLLIVAGAVALAITAATSDNPAEDLEKRVTALQERVDSLEKQLQAMRVQMTQAAAAGADTAALDAEAEKAYAEIVGMVNAGKTAEAKAKLAQDRQKYARTKYAHNLVTLAAELEVVGKDKPADWGIEKWFQGQSEIDLASDKKTTLVVFWEEWCPHCRREVPKMQELYHTYKGQGLQIVGLTKINKSATEEKVTQFLADQKVAYPIAKENGTASEFFAVRGIPAAAVVKDGKVVWRGHPARLTEAQIKAWL